jgi:hypothetical protein
MADLLSTAEAAAILGKSKSTVIYRARLGELPYVHKNPSSRGAYVFDRAVIEAAAKAELADPQQISA